MTAPAQIVTAPAQIIKLPLPTARDRSSRVYGLVYRKMPFQVKDDDIWFRWTSVWIPHALWVYLWGRGEEEVGPLASSRSRSQVNHYAFNHHSIIISGELKHGLTWGLTRGWAGRSVRVGWWGWLIQAVMYVGYVRCKQKNNAETSIWEATPTFVSQKSFFPF